MLAVIVLASASIKDEHVDIASVVEVTAKNKIDKMVLLVALVSALPYICTLHNRAYRFEVKEVRLPITKDRTNCSVIAGEVAV